VALRCRILPIVCLVFSGVMSLVFGQLDRGTITGVVTDPTDAVIANATITVTNVDTNVQSNTVTTQTGNFTVAALLLGRYRVQVQAAGFKTTVRDDVIISAGSTVRVDVTLELGEATQRVEVAATIAPLASDSSRVATNITNKLVDDIPLEVNGQIRSVFDLATLTPDATVGASGLYRVAGGQDGSWDMQMDGSSITPTADAKTAQRVVVASAPIDAISEFTVDSSSGMKAEYGRAVGMINFVTKSGTDQYHGDAYEFLRNDALDARGFFASSKPRLQQDDFGATVGGPLYLPKIYNGKHRTFVFFSYEGYRQRAGAQPAYYTVPTEANYQGDFSGYTNSTGKMIPIYDPATTVPNPSGAGYARTPFPDNQIPQSRFSQFSTNFIGLRPPSMVPNLPGIVNNYFLQAGSVVNPWNKGTARIDHRLSSKDNLGFFFMRAENTNVPGPGGIPGLPYPYTSGQAVWDLKNTNGNLSWNRTISPHVLNEVRFTKMVGFGFVNSASFENPNMHWGALIGVQNAPGPDLSIPPINFTAPYTSWDVMSSGGHGQDDSWLWSISEALTVIRGSHTFKMGVGFEKNDWAGGGQEQPNGSYSFSQLATAIPGDQSQATGNSLASFLLGYPNSVSLTTPRHEWFLIKDINGYIQDDWRVTSKLVLNLGLRYDYSFGFGGGGVVPGVEPGFSNFSPTTPNPGAGGIPGAVVFTGTGPGRTGSTSPFGTWPWEVQPRAGLAYSLRPGTVLRMSAGRGFEQLRAQSGTTNYDGFIFNSSFTSSDLDINSFPTPTSLALPTTWKVPNLTPTVDNGLNISWFNPSQAGIPAQYWTWNFDIQQQLSPSTVLSARYTAIRGEHLTTSGLIHPNQISPSYLTTLGPALLTSSITSASAQAAGIQSPYPGFSGTVQQALQPFPQYKTITMVQEHDGDSDYQGLIVTLDRRFSSGFTMLASYSLSKMFSDTDSTVSASAAENSFNLRLSKALSNDDQTHRIRYSLSYELPFGAGRQFLTHGLLSRVVGQWAVAASAEYSSGLPLGVASGVTLPIGGGADMIFITSYDNWRAPVSGKFDPFKDLWWNMSAFQQEPQSVLSSQMGNSTVLNPKTRLPWNLNENLNLARTFPVKEKFRLTFRAEAFDLLNRVIWAAPDSTVTDAGFGQVRSQANLPRQLQLVLKLYF
jgi:Carboxypeptidase regulatory-like domain